MNNFITTTIINKLMHIQFNRPDKMNAITREMYESLNESFDKATADAKIHGILISSTSDHFTSGNDLADFLKETQNIADSAVIKFIFKLANFKKPLIAAVKGNAIGIGTTLLLHCDLVYADPSALFATPFAKLGLVPEAGSSYLLPKLIGNAKAAKMLLLGAPMKAAEAAPVGLITELYEQDDFDEYVLGMAQKLTNLPHQAVLASKALIDGDNQHLLDHMKAEVQQFGHMLAQDEFKAIAKAFLSKN